jgi:tetratricopeptide (TPR) repeat protein
MDPDLEALFDDANGDLALGELESAVQKYRQCVEKDPDFFDGWHALGMALMKTGRYPEAIEAGLKAVALRPASRFSTCETTRSRKRNRRV